MVVRLQQQAVSWTSGNASHRTGESLLRHYCSLAQWENIAAPDQSQDVL